jgi:hypothetical protein
MLEPWIIEQIRRREEEERRRHERPQLELPVPADRWPPSRRPGEQTDDGEDRGSDDDDEQKRGVVIIGI